MELFFFVINAKNSHPEMIAKTHQIRVENNVLLLILMSFRNHKIYFSTLFALGSS